MLRFHTGYCKTTLLTAISSHCIAAHGRPQKFFQGGNVDVLLTVFILL